MPLYYCKAPDKVVAMHTDDQAWVDPVIVYGVGAYLLIDIRGPAAVPIYLDDPNSPAKMQIGYQYPTITVPMHTASVKAECQRRILIEVSDTAQRNLATYTTQLQQKQINGVTLTPTEESDLNTANAVWNWIGASVRGPTSMLGTSDALIAAFDLEFYQDTKWPPWNSAWDAFIAKF